MSNIGSIFAIIAQITSFVRSKDETTWASTTPQGITDDFPSPKNVDSTDDTWREELDFQHPGNHTEAVFASKFLADCEYDKARAFLEVDSIFGEKSYSGFLTVNAKYNSNLFFWFFLSESDPNSDPIIVWLIGYPGFSSMYAVFRENGPFRFVSGKLNSSEFSWTKRYNVLYIDSPVGIGYSFTENVAGFSASQEDVSNNLYSFMNQFFEIFAAFRKNELFVGGESYGGKFAVSLAYEIHRRNPTSHTKMNLQGVFVGNGFVDPANMLAYSSFLYRLGIIDYQTYLQMRRLENYIVRLIEMREWKTANRCYDKIHDKLREVGFEHPYDFTREKFDPPDDRVTQYMNEPETRKWLHVGEVEFHNHEQVYKYLEDDILQSVKTKVEEMLPYYRMLFYTGQFDMMVSPAKINKFARTLRWIDAIRFSKQQPINWYVDGDIVGAIQSVSNLTEVLIRNANHVASVSQPANIYYLLRLFVDGGPFEEDNLYMSSGD